MNLSPKTWPIFDRSKWGDLVYDAEDPRRTAAGFALGALVGFTPVLGVHTWLALALASLLRVPPLASLVGTNLSNPITFIPITLLEIRVGQAVLGRPMNLVPNSFAVADLGNYALAAWMGYLLIAPVVAAVSGMFVHQLLRLAQKRRNLDRIA
jgi:hypothetical protein